MRAGCAKTLHRNNIRVFEGWFCDSARFFIARVTHNSSYCSACIGDPWSENIIRENVYFSSFYLQVYNFMALSQHPLSPELRAVIMHCYKNNKRLRLTSNELGFSKFLEKIHFHAPRTYLIYQMSF